MDKRKVIIYTLVSVLVLLENCYGGPLHRRYIRNIDNAPRLNDDTRQQGHNPDNIGIDSSNNHPSYQSDVLAINVNGERAGQSQDLLANENAGNNDQSNGVSLDHDGSHLDQSHTASVDGGNVDQSQSPSVVADQMLDNDRPSLVDGDNENNQEQPANNNHENLNIDGQGDGEVYIGVPDNSDGGDALQDVHEHNGAAIDIEAGENGVNSEAGRPHNDVSNVNAFHNETTEIDEKMNTANISLTHSNIHVPEQDNVLTSPTTISHLPQRRRNLPENMLQRDGVGHFLLDASLNDGPTTEARVNHLNYSSSGGGEEQHRPFLLDVGVGEGITNQSQEIALGHGTPVGTLPDSANHEGQELTVKDDLNNDVESHEHPEQHHNNPHNNNENTIAVIHAVTLSNEGIIPDEKHSDENNEPEVVLVNQNHTTTTAANSENENIGNEGENQGPEAGVDIPIDKGRYNHSDIPEGVEPGEPRHTLNPLILPRTTDDIFPSIQRLSTTERTNILPTPAIVDGHTVEYETGTAALTTGIAGENEHEHSGSGSDVEGGISGNGQRNTEAECQNGDEPISGEGRETEGSGSAVESSNNEGLLLNEAKHNKERDKIINCRTSSNDGSTAVPRVSFMPEHTSSVMSSRDSREQSLALTNSAYTTHSFSDSLSSSVIENRIHTQQLNMYSSTIGFSLSDKSDILASVSDYESEYVSSIIEASPETHLYQTTSSFTNTYVTSSSTMYISEGAAESFESLGDFLQSSMPSVDVYSFSPTTILPTAASVYDSDFSSTLLSSSLISKSIDYQAEPLPVSVESSSAYSTSLSPESRSSPIAILPSSSSAITSIPNPVTILTSLQTVVTPSSLPTDLPGHSTASSSNSLTSTPRSTSEVYSTDTSTRAGTTPSVTPNNGTRISTPMVPRSTKMKLPDSTTNTATPTTKKHATIKATEKPETYSSTTSGQPLVAPSGAVMTLSPIHEHKTTKLLPLTTPPQVFLTIWIRMSSCQFYFQKPVFITELQQLIVTETQVKIKNEQFVVKIKDLPEEYCEDIPNEIIAGGEELGQIPVVMYMTDKWGNFDIRLTYDVSDVIKKGFKNDSSAFKDKIVRVDVQNSLPNTRPNQEENSVETTEEDASVAMVIVLGTVGGCCCVILVILQVILIHRRVTSKRKASYISRRVSIHSLDHVALGVIPKSRPNSGYWNPALTEELYVSKHSHLLNCLELSNFCMDDTSIYDEFQTIPCEKPDSSVVPIGEDDKNRFVNVLPYKHTRVKLRMRPRDVSDYINANFVSGYKGNQKAYIATQSPLVNTVEDFWRMVWEQQSRVILMLNPVLASRKPKQSTCYWPDDMKTDVRRLYGDYSVTLKKREVQQDYIECTLELMDLEGNLKREIRHFWLTSWPESTTLEPLKFVKFILDTRPHYENSGASAIVHCGPGQGRTGALIAVDVCMRRFEEKRRVDILDCVFKMRNERAGAVQNKEQYALIYKSLNEYAVLLSSPSLSTRSSIITLHAML